MKITMKKVILLIVLATVVFLIISFSLDETESNHSKIDDGLKEVEKNTKDITVDAEDTVKEEVDETNNESDWEEILSAHPQPKTIKEVFDYPIGEFADYKYDEDESDRNEMLDRFKTLPKLEEEDDNKKLEAYWNRIYSLTNVEYPDIDSLINQIQSSGYGSPDIEDSRYQYKENLNVEIILDASGSMAAPVDGRPKMDIAKETINSFLAELPKEAHVGLRVYGHEGTGSESDKEFSCNSSELVYELSSYNEEEFNAALNQFSPSGWTPIALALENAMEDLANYSSDNNTNIIYLVSDGIETCGEDPVVVADSLANSDITPIVNIIGFDINQEGANQLKQVAAAAKGAYSSVDSEDELRNELESAKQLAAQWIAWKDDALVEVIYQHSENRGDVTGFYNDFFAAFSSQSRNIEGVLRDLYEVGHISEDVYRALDEKRAKWYNLMRDFNTQIRSELYKMADNVDASLREAIEKEADYLE